MFINMKQDNFTDEDKELTKLNTTKINIVFIGDSNTEGYNLEHAQSYPYLLSQRFSQHAVIYNCGLSGTCVINHKIDDDWVGFPYVEQPIYKKALRLNGDLYVINLGTNDATDGEDDVLDEINPYGNLMAYSYLFKKHYESILDSIYAVNPKVMIILCIPIPVRKSFWRKHKQKYLDQLAKEIYIIAEQRGLQVIDLMSYFYQKEDIEALYLDDGIHLSPSGAIEVANRIEKDLKALLTP